MQKELIIDLENLKKSGLGIGDYVTLQAIYEGININIHILVKEILQKELYIKLLDDGSIEPRQKLLDLFEKSCKSINFDEFWMVFPTQTPSGRSLRSVNKEFAGKPTTNYLTAKKKYLARVKHINIHNKIIEIIKARVASGDIEYMNNIETYINRQFWQVDVKYLNVKKETASIYKMI